MSSLDNNQKCIYCQHMNENNLSFCQRCQSLLPSYFFQHYQKNHRLPEHFKKVFASSMENKTVERTLIRSVYKTEWKSIDRIKVENWQIPSALEMEFENERVYPCPQCNVLKEFANPCPECQYPLQLLQSTSLKISIQEILGKEGHLGFQSLLNDRYLHFRHIVTSGDLISMSEGAQAGLIPIVVPRRQHPSLYITSHYYQHSQSKEVRLFNNTEVDEGFFPLFDLRHYPYTYQSRVAAYMIPKDIRVGEVVLLEDLIEDFIGSVRHFAKRLASAPAIWDGTRMVVLYSREHDVKVDM
jgi:hypothetical protein